MGERIPCNSCGSTNYYFFRKFYSDKGSFEECSSCSKGSIPHLSPDVFFDRKKGSWQTDPNLCGRNGIPIPFSGKREKAAIMKQLNVREAGDSVKGSRNFDKKSAKQWEGVNKI